MKHIRKILLLSLIICHAIICNASEITWHNMLIDNLTNPVYSVFKDQHGLLWVGTNHGLYTYDGHIFRKVNINKNISVSEAHYHAMAENGYDIYFGTNNGLFVYNSNEKTLSLASEGMPSEIRCLRRVGNILWIGSLYGLYSLDLSHKTVRKYDNISAAIYSLVETKDGIILLGTYDGMFKIDPQTNNCEELMLPMQVANKHIFVNSILEDRMHECIWIGTEGCLLKYMVRTGAILQQKELDGNSIKSLCFANNMDLLIGTDNGLYIIKSNGGIEVCRHNSKLETTIANNVIWTLYQEDNRIWAGTEYGLSLYDDSDGLIRIRLEDITGRSDGNQIYSLCKDHKGSLWIGGTNGLIHWKDYPSMDNIADWYTSDNRENFISHNHVRQIHEANSKDIWIATDGGINLFEYNKKRLINYKVYDKGQKHNAIWSYSIRDDINGNIWIGSYMGGVMSINPSRVPNINANIIADTVFTEENGLANNLVGQIEIDKFDNIWIMLFRDKRIFRVENGFKKISSVDILSMTGRYPESILLDEKKNLLWVGYDGGIIAIDQNLNHIQTIEFGNKEDINKILTMSRIGTQIWISSYSGIWVIDTYDNALTGVPFIKDPITSIYYDNDSRRVLMGSIDKILSLNPSILNNNNLPSTLDIMSVTLNDSVNNSTGTVLSKSHIFEVENDHNKISIDLSCLNFDPNRSFRYAYRIDKKGEWIKLKEGEYRITISNLERGNHIIDFTIGDSDEAMASIEIHVSGPWYSSVVAYVIYGLLLILIILSIMIAIRKKAKAKAEEEDRRRSVIAVQNRINFLSNISHDLKTPLSLIVGPISKMLEECTDPQLKNKLSQIYENAIKLNSMVHKAIEINRLNNDNEALMILSRINVVEFCKNVFDTYKENHLTRHFVFSSSNNSIIIDIDAIKMESVLNNLLSNACKYSNQDSTISCSVSYEQGVLIIMVSDDGVGIPKDEQSLIFHRLFRSNRTADLHEGSGIGLYLVKQYVELHGGTIEVESQENEGSTFIIKIPSKTYDIPTKQSEAFNTNITGLPKVLIVEDNISISDFIKEVLSKQYQCVTATNGRAGLSVASTYRPDIIITDEMMPVMSGLEMCARIKENPYIASTPIIMLTAKDDNLTETESVKLGINIFMPKPFSSTLLQERVKQLL